MSTASTRLRAIGISCHSCSSCRGRLGLDTVGFPEQFLDSTASGDLVLYRQPDKRRDPRSPGHRRSDRAQLPRNQSLYV
ncbi:hypothetical protein ACGF5O_48025 [Streptomyces sp. NPDC048291]|uniref:hypothetical protein n=1 Tax=Streptomyces sp. NPDC048291 TaxID=3365530 RepID=UPI003710CC49